MHGFQFQLFKWIVFTKECHVEQGIFLNYYPSSETQIFYYNFKINI